MDAKRTPGTTLRVVDSSGVVSQPRSQPLLKSSNRARSAASPVRRKFMPRAHLFIGAALNGGATVATVAEAQSSRSSPAGATEKSRADDDKSAGSVSSKTMPVRLCELPHPADAP